MLYFGTPVALIATVNPDGSSNISPISSAWALGDRYMLGLGAEGQAAANIERIGDLVINLPSADLVHTVEAIAAPCPSWVPRSAARHGCRCVWHCSTVGHGRPESSHVLLE